MAQVADLASAVSAATSTRPQTKSRGDTLSKRLFAARVRAKSEGKAKSGRWKNVREGAIRERLKRADSKRTLVAENAKYARKVLEEFAGIHRPKYSLLHAMLFGAFIDIFVLLKLPVGNELMRALIRHGGPEQVRFLLCVATFDSDHNGEIDDQEWAQYEKVGDLLIADSVAMCGNMGIVGALLLGLTHLVTLGRPLPYELSEASSAFFGGDRSVVWVSYTCNVAAEAAAFFTLCIAVITRNNLTNVLPTRELKIDMLRSSNALGTMGVGLMLTLWFFVTSTAVGTLVASPKEGFVGTGLFVVCTMLLMRFVAPLRYLAVLLLHEEVKRFLLDKSGSFLKQASENDPHFASSFARAVALARKSRVGEQGAGDAVKGSDSPTGHFAGVVLARAAAEEPRPSAGVSHRTSSAEGGLNEMSFQG